jgi:BirA family biotin operon repressor/biotin-[acetyl-CoA-carboxylase] ligase
MPKASDFTGAAVAVVRLVVLTVVFFVVVFFTLFGISLWPAKYYKILSNPFLQIGSSVLMYEEVDSTNRIARELAVSHALPEGTVVVAKHQREGRGQQNAVWESEAGLNLLATYILTPLNSEIHRQVVLNMAVANAIHRWISKYTDNCHIKWPNDILARGKKTGGILIENNLSGNEWKSSFIGVGVNINQEQFTQPNATSLFKLTGNTYDVAQCLKELTEELRKELLLFSTSEDAAIRRYYLSHLFLLHEEAEFSIDTERVKGIIQDVDDAGRLLVSINGNVRAFNNKEIRFLAV